MALSNFMIEPIKVGDSSTWSVQAFTGIAVASTGLPAAGIDLAMTGHNNYFGPGLNTAAVAKGNTSVSIMGPDGSVVFKRQFNGNDIQADFEESPNKEGDTVALSSVTSMISGEILKAVRTPADLSNLIEAAGTGTFTFEVAVRGPQQRLQLQLCVGDSATSHTWWVNLQGTSQNAGLALFQGSFVRS